MTRMIILAGAPESTKLDWSEKSLLPESMHVESLAPPSSSASSKAFGAQWRQVTTQRLQMRPVLPKLEIDAPPPADELDRGGAEFFSADEYVGTQTPGSDVSGDESQSQPSGASADTTSEALSDYYDHSFAIYEAIPSSQLSAFSDYTPGTPTYESNDEMFPQTPGSGGGIIRTPSQRRLSQAPRPKHLSDLEDIPNARYLSSIEPQTMTVNLIVGILSIAPPRTVITGTKYGKPRETDLVEMVVGDDTKTGFSISMWLPREMRVNWKDGANSAPEGSRSFLRRNLRTLRPRDVVLLQNVALSSFRGKVHGQSLKGDVTKVDLLFRKKVDDDDLGGIYSASNLRTASGRDPQILKVKKVRDWLLEFVGDREGGGPAKGRRGGSRLRRDYGFLPDDSQ